MLYNKYDNDEFLFDEKEQATMKTKEELNALKNEVESLNAKLMDLSEEELTQVVGGVTCSGEGEVPGNRVGFFPGLSGFP